MTRDDIIQLLLVTVTASGFGASIAVMHGSGYDSGDVFAFTGAIVGAAGTVAGAAWLADRSATRELRTERRLIRPELVDLLTVAENAAVCFPADGGWSGEWLSAAHALADVSRGVASLLDEVLTYARTLDFRQRDELKAVRQAITAYLRFYDDALTPGELDPMDDRTWASETHPLREATAIALRLFPDI